MGAELKNTINDLVPNNACVGKIKISTKDIFKILLSLLVFRLPHIKPIPKSLISAGNQFRPGLSPRRITSKIISRQTEAGAPIDTGGVHEKMTLIMVEEIVKAIQQDAKGTTELPPGVKISGIAQTPAGPAPFTGLTTDFAKGSNILT